MLLLELRQEDKEFLGTKAKNIYVDGTSGKYVLSYHR